MRFVYTVTCWFQQVGHVQQFLKDKSESVLAFYQDANSKQTEKQKQEKDQQIKEPLLVDESRCYKQDSGRRDGRGEKRSKVKEDDINRISPNSTECSKKQRQMSVQPSVNPRGALQKDLERNSIAAFGIKRKRQQMIPFSPGAERPDSPLTTVPHPFCLAPLKVSGFSICLFICSFVCFTPFISDFPSPLFHLITFPLSGSSLPILMLILTLLAVF